MKMERMERGEFEHLAPATPGTVRANHSGGHCSGTSDSLLITRKEDGDISAYCFRCCRSGFVGAKRHYRPPTLPTAVDASDGERDAKGKLLPRDTSKVWDEFPRGVRRWLNEARLDKADCTKWGMCWSESAQSLFIPVKRKGEFAGWVVRGFGDDASRYRTWTDERDRFYGHVESPAPGGTVVLVEDVLSGIRVGKLADCIVLCGTNIRPAAIGALIEGGYTEAVVFLDGDNSMVRQAARKIAKRLPFLRTRIVETGKDPKHHSDEELVSLIYLDDK